MEVHREEEQGRQSVQEASCTRVTPKNGMGLWENCFLGNTAPGGLWLLSSFLRGTNYLESPHPHRHPGHILALDIEVEDTDVVYQDSEGPVGEVGSGLP